MKSSILSSTLFLIFLILAIFHFYWLFGGKGGLKKVIPTKSKGEDPLPIPKFATLIVALVFVFFGLIYLLKIDFWNLQIPNWLTRYIYWLIPILFIVRAIGDFNYVGLFKKIKDTEFAKADSKIFIPLCLFIGLIGILVQILEK